MTREKRQFNERNSTMYLQNAFAKNIDFLKKETKKLKSLALHLRTLRFLKQLKNFIAYLISSLKIECFIDRETKALEAWSGLLN